MFVYKNWLTSIPLPKWEFVDYTKVSLASLARIWNQVLGLPWWFRGKESACQRRRPGFDPWVGTIPWRRKWQPTPVFLPGKSHGQRSLSGYSSWCHKRVRHDLVTKQQSKFTKNRDNFICVHQSFQNHMASYLFLGPHISFFSLSTFHGHLWYDQVQLKSGSVQTCLFKNYG